MGDQNGMKFGTKDVDNDLWSGICGVQYRGGWWYSNCFSAHLNGEYLRGQHNQNAHGVNWYTFKGNFYSNKVAEMKVGRDQD